MSAPIQKHALTLDRTALIGDSRTRRLEWPRRQLRPRLRRRSLHHVPREKKAPRHRKNRGKILCAAITKELSATIQVRALNQCRRGRPRSRLKRATLRVPSNANAARRRNRARRTRARNVCNRRRSRIADRSNCGRGSVRKHEKETQDERSFRSTTPRSAARLLPRPVSLHLLYSRRQPLYRRQSATTAMRMCKRREPSRIAKRGPSTANGVMQKVVRTSARNPEDAAGDICSSTPRTLEEPSSCASPIQVPWRRNVSGSS